jgi:zinc transporter
MLRDGAYGSDEAGLVWAYRFEPGHASEQIDSDEATRVLRSLPQTATCLWLHFDLSNAAAARWIRTELQLSESFYEALRDSPSTRVETATDSLVAVVHDLRFFGADTGASSTLTIFIDDRLIVSARTTQLRAVDRLREAIKKGAVFESPTDLFAHLLRDQADVLVETVREVAVQVDAVEDSLTTTPEFKSRALLGLARRRLIRLQRSLAPEPAALFRLLSRPPDWLRPGDIGELRRSAEELSLAVADSGAVIERVRILQDELSAQLNEATNRTLYILTVLTAIAVPFEFIPALFGMEVGGVPLRDNPHGFAVVFVIILLVIGVGAMFVRRLIRH